MSTKTPRQFFKPLAIGAPQPLRDLPVKLERMIHFVPGHNDKVRSKTPDMATKVDVILANLEDAIPADAKIQARAGAIEMAGMVDWKKLGTGLWTRVNPLNSPWFLDDVTEIVTKAGNIYDVIMLPKVEGPGTFTMQTSWSPSLKPRPASPAPSSSTPSSKPDRASPSSRKSAPPPRMQGISLGPADLAANRAMKTTRVGGGHPMYKVIEDPIEGKERLSAQQDPWHYTLGKMVDACVTSGIKPFYGPFGDIADLAACEQQFKNAYLMGCAGAGRFTPARSTSPSASSRLKPTK